jgi:hypothetical protein
VKSTNLLQLLNENGLWRNPLRIQILSSELGISAIALMRRMNRRGIIRGPYMIDDDEQKRLPASKRSQVAESYSEMTGDPRSKVTRLVKKYGIAETEVRRRLRSSCGAQWYRREFDRTSASDKSQLVKLLNRNGRWKLGGVVKAVAKELGVTKASLTLRMSRWSIVRGPYVQLRSFEEAGASKPEQYAYAFEQGRGDHEGRVRRIAKANGVAPKAVKAALRKLWGPERYRKELQVGPKHTPEALLALMNDARVQNSDDMVGTAAKRLGIKRQSLMSILSRKGIRRTGKRYVWRARPRAH